MNAKLQKEYKLIVGTNNTNKKISDLDEAVVKLELYGNGNLDLRFHIKEKNNYEGDIIRCCVCNKICKKDPDCDGNWLCPDKECSVHKEV